MVARQSDPAQSGAEGKYSMLILEDDGSVFEVPDDDCEVEGDGFWLLAADGEDEEEFYEFCDVEVELDEDSAE
jgi:hypothetical protein